LCVSATLQPAPLRRLRSPWPASAGALGAYRPEDVRPRAAALGRRTCGARRTLLFWGRIRAVGRHRNARPPYEYGFVPKADGHIKCCWASCRKVWAATSRMLRPTSAWAAASDKAASAAVIPSPPGRNARLNGRRAPVKHKDQLAHSHRTAPVLCAIGCLVAGKDVPRPQGFAWAGIVSGKGRAQSPTAGLAAGAKASAVGSPRLRLFPLATQPSPDMCCAVSPNGFAPHAPGDSTRPAFNERSSADTFMPQRWLRGHGAFGVGGARDPSNAAGKRAAGPSS
jgi:hypothetical protein